MLSQDPGYVRENSDLAWVVGCCLDKSKSQLLGCGPERWSSIFQTRKIVLTFLSKSVVRVVSLTVLRSTPTARTTLTVGISTSLTRILLLLMENPFFTRNSATCNHSG